MKILKYIWAGALVVVLAVACNEGIDPISRVDPGSDESAPSVVITYPSIKKIIIPFTDTETSLDIQFEVKDDIEIGSITVSLDGTQIAMFDSFLDYRRTVRSYLYEKLPVGEHSVQVTATDLEEKSTTQSFTFEISNVYEPLYDGEIFYMPFEGASHMDLISKSTAGVVGSPGFGEGKVGMAYTGSTGAYLTFPTAGIIGEEFSAAFWYKINANPDRSGILTISPPNPDNPALNNLKNGFRFFREGSATSQTFKLNVGHGADGSWFDGGPAASINPATADWVFLAFTITGSHAAVYINGEVVSEADFPGVDWTNCDALSIASGQPRFIEWSHFSDQSRYDELRFFNKALSKEEIQAVMNGD